MRYPFLPGILFSLALGMAGAGAAMQNDQPVPLVTGKAITPQGSQTGVGSFPASLALSPDGRYIAVANTGFRQFVSILSVQDGRLIAQLPFNETRKDGSNKKEGLYYGLAFGAPAGGKATLYVSRGAEDRVSILTLDADGALQNSGRVLNNPSGVPDFKAPHHIAGLALSADGRRLFAVNNHTSPETGDRGSLSILDPATNRVMGKVTLPGFPYAVAAPAVGPAAGKVYVTSERDRVVSVVDPAGPRLMKSIETGDHPMALVADRKGERVFVANAGSDTVTVLDARSDAIRQTILLRPDDARGLPGATPTGLALAPNERRLYVTLGDMNAVAVIELPRGRLLGYIPVGWYPTAAVVAPDGKHLLVANAKGVGARNPNPAPADRRAGTFAPGGAQYIQNVLEGTVSRIELPGNRTLREWTGQVVRNNRLFPRMEQAAHPDFKNPGIEHVVYILKENRTYDQILGDLPQGNGDPKLCFFPREVTPNQHALAERFVLLDNFYCCAEVSADGWNWSTSGMANEYVARNAPYGYSGRGRVYDYEGQNNGVPVDLLGRPDVARAPNGYIWDHVAAKGLTFRNYGFFVDAILTDAGLPNVEQGPNSNQPTKRALLGSTDVDFRQFDMAYADSDAWVRHNAPAPVQARAFGRFHSPSRFAEWKREFDGYVKNGNMPRFQMIRLPRDHTQGTAVGFHSPRAMVADNDYGLGQIIEALSKSPFWKKTAVFVIEDDAQNGFDHVDAHRSVCFVISPFIRRATIDHRFYNTDSVLRTMMLLMGLPPMNQYDAVAPPLDVFGSEPRNAAPYDAILPPRAICAEVNGRGAYRAKDSARLDFTKEDAVPDDLFNDILWHAIMGKQTPKPSIRYGLRIGPKDDDD